MTTREWMTKNYQKEGAYKYFGSIVRDEKGNLFSYGQHYPLLFKLGNLDIVNTAGYSVSTSRHISWAMQSVNYKHTPVALPRDFRLYTWEDQSKLAARLMDALRADLHDLVKVMDSKKRKNTQVYANLQGQHELIVNAMAAVAAV